MIRRGGCNWTAVAVDEVPPIFFTKTGRAAQLLQNVERSINSLLAGSALQLVQMFFGYSSASGAHSCAQVSWLNLPRKYRHEKRDQSPVCLRKQMFGVRSETIRNVRFANARLQSRLDHESVALEAGKVRSHSIISEAQLFREFVDRPLSRPKEAEDFPPRAFEQPLPPAYMFHSLKDHEDSE